MKLKTFYFKDSLENNFYSVEAKSVRGALTQIKKKQLEHAKDLGKSVFWTIYESKMIASKIRCILVTYVYSNGDIKQDVL